MSREKQAKSCDYEEFEGQDLGYADIQVVARNPKEVRITRCQVPANFFRRPILSAGWGETYFIVSCNFW